MFFFLMQYVAYADGLIRAYNIHTYAVHYTLQREMTIDSFFFFVRMVLAIFMKVTNVLISFCAQLTTL